MLTSHRLWTEVLHPTECDGIRKRPFLLLLLRGLSLVSAVTPTSELKTLNNVVDQLLE